MKLFGAFFLVIFGFMGPTVLGATEKSELRQQHDNIVLSSNASSQSLADNKMVELSADDRMKMKKLKQEALDKLNEMGRIVSRNLGIKGKKEVSVFIPLKDKSHAASSRNLDFDKSTGRAVIHCFEMPDGSTACGCYDEEKGTCGPCNIADM